MKPTIALLAVVFGMLAGVSPQPTKVADVSIRIDTRMEPPRWAVLSPAT